MKFTVNGQEVFAATGGKPFDPTLPLLVFIHGAGMDHSVWQQQARYFAHHGYAVLAVDLPAHGGSKGAPLDNIAKQADWIADAIVSVGASSASLVGHSMGALAALDAASRHSDKVGILALLGVGGEMPVHPDLLDAAAANDHKAIDIIADWGYGRRAHRGGNIAPGIWLINTGIRLLERARPGILSNDLAAADAYKRALDAAANVKCPTLCLLGTQDKMTPIKAALPLVEAISNVKKVVLPNTGHMMMAEAPGATLNALIDFLGVGAAI